MKREILAPEADCDLMEIARRIAKRNLPAAYRFIDRVSEIGEFLASNPEMGRRRDELEPGLRSFPIGSFVCCFTVAGEAAASKSPVSFVVHATSQVSFDAE